ncbi:MAG: hypothetical protein ACP5OO_08350 [Chloroflexia bacterium]
MEQEKPQSRFRQIVAAVMALVALWGTVVGFLGADASIREARATRDSEVLAIEVMAALDESNAHVGYDLVVMSDWLMLQVDGVVNQATAVSLQGKAGEDLIQYYDLRGRLQDRVAASLVPESTLLSDARYVRSLENGEIDTAAYIQDQYRRAADLLKEQNIAADEARRWGDKSNTYTSVLTLLAVGLFLLGLALVPESRIRLLFLALGLLVALVDVGWTLALWLG